MPDSNVPPKPPQRPVTRPRTPLAPVPEPTRQPAAPSQKSWRVPLLVGGVAAAVLLSVVASVWLVFFRDGPSSARASGTGQESKPSGNSNLSGGPAPADPKKPTGTGPVTSPSGQAPIDPIIAPKSVPAEPKIALKKAANTDSQVPKPGEVRQIEIAPGVSMAFCWVPAGECQLGSPKAERDAVLKQLKQLGEKTEPKYLQTETEEKRGKYSTPGFWMGKYEVTQAEWSAVMKGVVFKGEDISTPSKYRAGGEYATSVKGLDTNSFPVDGLSWDMICDKGGYLERLNAHGGIEKAFGYAGKFALPHENQWEYACRGGKGNKQAFYWGGELNGTQANCSGEYPFGTTEEGPFLRRVTTVGSYEKKLPHPWGLCDMHGNAMEMCENSYDQTNRRAVRGGWSSGFANESRAAYRGMFVDQVSTCVSLGCRIVLSLN